METKCSFQEVEIGQMFHTGKSHGIGINSDVVMYKVYKKHSKSTAVLVEQVGFHNNRHVGNVERVSATSTVWLVD